jgi:hypothetical protein
MGLKNGTRLRTPRLAAGRIRDARRYGDRAPSLQQNLEKWTEKEI